MTEIKNIKVYGLDESIIRSGLPMQTEYTEKQINLDDIKRAKNLAKSQLGSGHSNYLKGIIVQFDIKYPEYLSPEMQRYHWFEIVSSMSKMHRLTHLKLNNNNCNKYVLKSIIDTINALIESYNNDPNYDNFMAVVSNCPLGFEKWMSITTNYLQLKTIYAQRKNHKLKEDWGAILEMIEKLPYSELII